MLVDLLDEDYAEQSELVVDALNGIGSVFELQSPTTKNDFCRMFIREGLLDPLTSALLNMMATRGDVADQMKKKIIQIVLVFSQVTQSDIHVRNALGTRKIVRRERSITFKTLMLGTKHPPGLLRACELLEPQYLVNMLKAVKHLSMNATLLEVLQNANALEILIRLLDEQSSGTYSAASIFYPYSRVVLIPPTGGLQPHIPNMLQLVPIEQVPAGGGCTGWHHSQLKACH